MINGIDYLKKMYPNRDEKDYQPSGMDLRVGRVFVLEDRLWASLHEGEKHLPNQIELEVGNVHELALYDGWVLEPHVPYMFEVQEQIKIGDENAQFYLPRSSLLRAGVNVYTALGDLGYNGHLRFLVINHRNGPFFIQQGERFAQLVDFEVRGGSESYDGDYQEKPEADKSLKRIEIFGDENKVPDDWGINSRIEF